jgi:bifunctional ADP-heptose synthase (sugar kinase/adenylyltransferase)
MGRIMISESRLNEILDQFEKVRIAVVGDMMLDEYLIGKVSRISPEAPVPVVNITEERFV